MLVFAILCISLPGIGWLINRRFSFFTAFWYGTAGVVIVLPVWHLFAAVNIGALLTVTLVGLAGIAFRLRSRDRIEISRLSLIFILLISPILLFRIAHPAYEFDDGLYHFQIVSWYRQYSVIPGLANLHGRFGFNSAFYLFASLFDDTRFVTPLLLIGLAGYFGQKYVNRSLSLWIAAVLIFMGNTVTGLSGDYAVLVIGIPLVMELWQLRAATPRLMIIVVALIMFKWSSAIFAAALGLIILKRLPMKKALITAVVCLVLLIPHLLHSVVLSGYPAYPVTAGAVSVQWQVPVAQAQADLEWVYSWAREPNVNKDQVLGSWTWLQHWLAHNPSNPILLLPLLVTISALLISVLSHGDIRGQWIIGVACLPALIYWFFTAPDIRFAVLPLWTLGGISFTLATEQRKRIRMPIIVLVIVYALVTLLSNVTFSPVHAVPKTTTQTNQTGLTIFIPVADEQCWFAPLPCAPSLDNTLQLIGKDLAGGFTHQDSTNSN